jgi:hypothetical protein
METDEGLMLKLQSQLVIALQRSAYVADYVLEK